MGTLLMRAHAAVHNRPMALLQQAPRLTVEAAADIAREVYGLAASASPLPSERDQNFLIAADADRFVLKIANATEDRAMLEAQNAAMTHLADRTTLCPRIVRAQSGEEIATLPSRWGGRHLVRLVTWLPGVTMASVARHSPALLEDLGRRVGEIDRGLTTFDHRAIHRDFYWDLANGLTVVGERVGLVQDRNLRTLVERMAARIERDAARRFATLRRSAIHNDPNDHNVLVGGGDDPALRHQRVVGLVDFGDMVYSVTVADLAIAIAYAVLDKPNPLSAAAAIVRGYDAANPLGADELDALFGLVCLRLCMSVAVAADQQRQRPDDVYLAVSQEPIRRTLPTVAAIPPALAAATFRHVCGLPAVPTRERVIRWLDKQRVAPVVASDGVGADLCVGPHTLVLDLGVGGPLVSGDPHENAEPALTLRIETLMRTHGATVALGRYGEARLLYTSPEFGNADAGEECRTIHLGVDLFAPAGTPVHAPLDGVVHAFADNAAPLDYGPAIILQHATGAEPFYTLYGHLSRESLDGLRVGQRIARGDRFAAIGTAGVNGGWPPHLHLQLIVDLLDLDC